jgi:hypothetical protein
MKLSVAKSKRDLIIIRDENCDSRLFEPFLYRSQWKSTQIIIAFLSLILY